MKRSGSNCHNCPLDKLDSYVTPDTTQHDLVFVAPKPTDHELWAGGYLKTKNGELLSRVCGHANVDMSNAGVAYAIQCKVPDGQKVTSAALVACRPGLLQELAHRAGEAVVSLGGEPAASLATQSVTTARVGPPKVLVLPDNRNIRYIPTVSPALCMMQQQHFPSLVTDISKLSAKAKTFIEPRYVVITDEQKAYDYLMDCAHKSVKSTLVIDIECIIDKETSFGHPEQYEMLCVGLKFDDHNPIVLAQSALTVAVYQALSELMGQSAIICHNGKFDLNGLRPHVGKHYLAYDTMLSSYVFDERSGPGGFHGLKYLAQEYLGAPNYDEEVKKYIGTTFNFGNVPTDILHKYNAFDVECTYLLWEMYDAMFDGQHGLHNLDMMLIHASNMLMDIEYNGICVDEEYLDKLSEELENKINEKQYKLFLTAKRQRIYDPKLGFNPNSPKQIKDFFADSGVGIDSSNEETLTKILNYEGELPWDDAKLRLFVRRLLAYRSEKKLKTTYVDGIRDRVRNGRVHTSYLLHGTTTGRLSSRNPNLQNIPRNSPVKRLFTASTPERVIVNVDYSQAELRVMTYLAKEEYFREIFNDPTRDVFDELVPELFPGSNKATDNPTEFKEKRTMVKTYVYGLGYGRTEYGIARGFGIPVEEAKKHKKRFFSTIPKLIQWQEDIKRRVLNGEDLVTPYGRHRRYSLITSENERDILNESLAFIPQSTASDMCLNAAIYVNNKFNGIDVFGATVSDGRRPRIVNLVHDAIMFECHKDDAEPLGELVSNAMIFSAQRIVGDYVEFATDFSYAYSWGDIK